MSAPSITRWIGIGLLGLPIYGVLTFFSSLNPQPDPNTHYEAWARYVTTDFYLLKHLFASGLGLILVIFGTIALGAYLITSRAGRMGLVGMVITVFGTLLFLMIGGLSIFAVPKEGQAFLAGIEEYAELPTILADTALLPTMGVGVLLMLVGNVLLGALWVAGSALPLLGQIYIILPIGADSTPPTVPAGAVLLTIGGAWMAYSVLRGPFAETVGVGAQPRVQ
jgi:hypothetical protein